MMNQQNLLKAAIVGVLLRNDYLADWHIADMLDIPRDEFGGCGTPGPGNDAIRELVRDGVIQPVIDLSCRYQIAGATIPALEARLTAAETLLAECQAQAAQLVRGGGQEARAGMNEQRLETAIVEYVRHNRASSIGICRHFNPVRHDLTYAAIKRLEQAGRIIRHNHVADEHNWQHYYTIGSAADDQ